MADSPATVFDAISKFFKGQCDASEIAKYTAAIQVKECDSDECFMTLACAQEIETPEFIVEAIQVESSGNCEILTGNNIRWVDWTKSDTASMGEWSQDLYYTPSRIKLMNAWLLDKRPKLIVIDVNDPDRTQFAYLALLTQFNATFAAATDSELSMIPTTWQPTGTPFITSGHKLQICSEKQTQQSINRIVTAYAKSAGLPAAATVKA